MPKRLNLLTPLALLVLLLFGGPAMLRAQTGAVAAFDSGYVETGNPFVLHLSLPGAYEQPQAVDWSVWDSLLPQRNLLQQSGWERRGNYWQNDVSFIAFDSAQLALPQLPIRLSRGEILLTNPLELRVVPTPSPDDMEGLADLKPFYPEPANWFDHLRRWWPIMLGILVLAVVIWWLLYRPKKNGLRGERRLQHPPHTLALLRLEALERQQHWQQGELKTYYSELTHIVREYLERRYQIPALESPTDDILRQLVHTDLPAEFLTPLAELLRWADLAKFAKSNPPNYFHQPALDAARRLIDATRPLAPSPETETSTAQS